MGHRICSLPEPDITGRPRPRFLPIGLSAFTAPNCGPRQIEVPTRNRKPLRGISIKVYQSHLLKQEELTANLPRVHRVIEIAHVHRHIAGADEGSLAHQIHEGIVDDAVCRWAITRSDPEKSRFIGGVRQREAPTASRTSSSVSANVPRNHPPRPIGNILDAKYPRQFMFWSTTLGQAIAPWRQVPTDQPQLRTASIQHDFALTTLSHALRPLIDGIRSGFSASSDADVHRAVGRLEIRLELLVASYDEVRRASPKLGDIEGWSLLIELYRDTLLHKGWLDDIGRSAPQKTRFLQKSAAPANAKRRHSWPRLSQQPRRHQTEPMRLAFRGR